MPTMTLPGLTLTDANFSNTVDVRMPEALALLISRLGATFFQLDSAGNFVPTIEAQQICEIVETRVGIQPTDITKNAATLTNAIYEAYARYAASAANSSAAGFFAAIP